MRHVWVFTFVPVVRAWVCYGEWGRGVGRRGDDEMRWLLFASVLLLLILVSLSALKEGVDPPTQREE